jgi:hypothetical protein
MEFEALLYIALVAYHRRTGELPDFKPSVSHETFSNAAGWGRSDGS